MTSILPVRKSCFTLLEILVVMMLISIGVVVTGLKIQDIYHEQRFNSETRQVINHLSMAQDLMLIMDTDVFVRFSPDEKKESIKMWLEVEKPLDQPWRRLVERRIPLTSIRSIEFDGTPSKKLTLQFSLGKMSKGMLILKEEENSKKKKERKLNVELLGYPSPFDGKSEKGPEQKMTERSELLYPAEVHEQLYKTPKEESQ